MEKTGSVYLERQNVDLQKDTFFFFFQKLMRVIFMFCYLSLDLLSLKPNSD